MKNKKGKINQNKSKNLLISIIVIIAIILVTAGLIILNELSEKEAIQEEKEEEERQEEQKIADIRDKNEIEITTLSCSGNHANLKVKLIKAESEDLQIRFIVKNEASTQVLGPYGCPIIDLDIKEYTLASSVVNPIQEVEAYLIIDGEEVLETIESMTC